MDSSSTGRRGMGWPTSFGKIVVVVGLALGSAASAWAQSAKTSPFPAAGQWAMGGQNLHNTRSQDRQRTLGVHNAGRLKLKWSRAVHGDVSATPAVVDGAVYLPDWGGYLTKLDASTGKLIWEHRIDSFAGEPQGAVSRTSPAVVDGVVYIGDQNGGHVLALDAHTGSLIWRSSAINPATFAIITQSPVVYKGVVYVGVSSLEEAVAGNPNYACCTFQGSFSAVDAKTGQIKWTTPMMPNNGGAPGGYSGAAVWSSTPAIDEATNTVFITTGNNYTVPASVQACELAGGRPATCLSPDDHVDSVVALDMATGRIKWSTGVQGYDSWTFACMANASPSTNCPPPPGEDFDIGSGPNLINVNNPDGTTRLLVGAGQKSGVYWLLDRQTGAIVSGTTIGPGSDLGGILWGTASDGTRIYVATSDANKVPYTVNGATVTTGSFAAIDPSTGKILWQLADPSGSATDYGAVSVSNGVVFAGSMSGHMYALNGATGAVLWDYVGQGSSNAGPAIDSNGTVYWGNGYSHFGLGAQGFTFYAFSVDGT